MKMMMRNESEKMQKLLFTFSNLRNKFEILEFAKIKCYL